MFRCWVALGAGRPPKAARSRRQRVALEDHTVKAPVADNGEVARTDYVAALVEALGMASEPFIEIPDSAFTAASAASEAFAHARQSNRLLDEELTERDEQARVALERAFARLEASFAPADDWKRQQLVSAYQEVDQNWSVLMLMPNGPYETVLKGLVEQLEADNGAGSLPAEEAALYSCRQASGRSARTEQPQYRYGLDQTRSLFPSTCTRSPAGGAGRRQADAELSCFYTD